MKWSLLYWVSMVLGFCWGFFILDAYKLSLTFFFFYLIIGMAVLFFLAWLCVRLKERREKRG